MAVDGCIDFEDEGRNEHIHAHAIQTKKSAAFLLLLVGPKTVERILQCRHLKTVPDEKFLPIAIERYDGRPGTQNGCEQVVANADSLT